MQECKRGVRGEGRGAGNAPQEWRFIIAEGEKVELSVDEMREKFREFWEEAGRLIGELGYYRRDGELAELEKWGEDVGW